MWKKRNLYVLLVGIQAGVDTVKNSIELLDAGTSRQDGSIGKHNLPPHTTTSKLQLKYRTTITQNCQKSVEWKSENYRIKETTSIQTVGRHADTHGLVPHPCVVGKNSGETSWERDVPAPHKSPQPRVPGPGR